MQLRSDAVLFDSDGVLVDSHDQVEEAWSQLAAEFDLDIDTLLVELVGARSVDTLARHVPADRLGLVVDRLEDLEVETAGSTRALAGALELLDGLPPGTWTIVTSATRRLAEARWRGAGITAPTRVVTAEAVTAGKPAPDPFLAGAALLEVDPSRCLAFEDSRPGGESAATAGATVIAVGGLPWDIEPAARVADLTGVRPVGTGGGVVIELTTSGAVGSVCSDQRR